MAQKPLTGDEIVALREILQERESSRQAGERAMQQVEERDQERRRLREAQAEEIRQQYLRHMERRQTISTTRGADDQ